MVTDGDDMGEGDDDRRTRHAKRLPRPLDAGALHDLALSYAARYATTGVKLHRYLLRKLRERGWAGADEPEIAAIVARFQNLGYIDDAAFARARADDLLRRGYGPRRVAQALGEAGVGEDVRRESVPDGDGEIRHAALTLAKKRRFGPFGREAPDPAARQRQLAAMVRAGHGFDAARALIDARDPAAAEAWAGGAE